jgi:hypothetical protein
MASDIILIDKFCETLPVIFYLNLLGFLILVLFLKSVGASDTSKLMGKSVITVSLSPGK